RDEPVAGIEALEQGRPIDIRLATPVHPPGWVHGRDLDPGRADRQLAPEDLANHGPRDLLAMADGGTRQPLDAARRAALARDATAHRRQVPCHELGARVVEHVPHDLEAPLFGSLHRLTIRGRLVRRYDGLRTWSRA